MEDGDGLNRHTDSGDEAEVHTGTAGGGDGPPPGCGCPICIMDLVRSFEPSWKIYDSLHRELERLQELNAHLMRRTRAHRDQVAKSPDASEDEGPAETPEPSSAAAAAAAPSGTGKRRAPGYNRESVARLHLMAIRRLEENYALADQEISNMTDVLFDKVACGLAKVVGILARAQEELKEWERSREAA